MTNKQKIVEWNKNENGGEIVKRTGQEIIDYFKTLGLTEEELKTEMEKEFGVDFKNIKYFYTVEGDYVECFADGVELDNGQCLVQTEERERLGIWLPALEVTYEGMIECLIRNCKNIDD